MTTNKLFSGPYLTTKRSNCVTVRGPDFVDRLVMGGLWLAMISVVVLSLLSAGCESVAVKAANEIGATKLAQAKNAATLKLEQTKADAAVKAAEGESSPLRHPILALEQTVKTIRGPLLWITILSSAAAIVFAGLWLASMLVVNPVVTFLAGVAKIGLPISLPIALLSGAALFALPILPWLLLAAFAAAIGGFVYLVVKDKSVTAAAENVETDIESLTAGATAKSPTAPAPTASKAPN